MDAKAINKDSETVAEVCERELGIKQKEMANEFADLYTDTKQNIQKRWVEYQKRLTKENSSTAVVT